MPLPALDGSGSSAITSLRPQTAPRAQRPSSALDTGSRSGATGATPSSDDMSSYEEPLPQWKLVKSKRRKKEKHKNVPQQHPVAQLA